MTDLHPDVDDRITQFMGRVADAFSSRDALPDPRLIWLKAELGRRLEGEKRAFRTKLVSYGIAALAIVLCGYLVVDLVTPIALELVNELGEAAVTTGISLASLAPVVWFFAFRPISELASRRHAR